jgi:hypothetical protein
MYALNFRCPPDSVAHDGLEALAPIRAPVRQTVARPRGGRLATAAVAGVGIAILITLSGAFAEPLILALGSASAFLYLGTAAISGRMGPAALDVSAAVAAIWIAVAASGPAISVLLVHVVWGVLRGAWPGVAPGRSFAASWAALNAMAALLLGFGS